MNSPDPRWNLSKIKEHLLDALFAQYCDGCEARVYDGVRLCPPCFTQLPRVRYACSCCGQQLGARADICGSCLTEACPQDATIAPFWFTTTLAEQIKQFKYVNQAHLARSLAHLLLNELQQRPRIKPTIATPSAFTAIVPIPSTRDKLIQRGFNPAAQIAHHLGKALRIPVFTQVLLKKPTAPSQVGSSRALRLQQMRGQFQINPTHLNRLLALADQRDTEPKVLLVDDVLTTGATLSAASKVLKTQGIAQITAVCLALSP